MNTFPFIFIPLHSYNSSIPLLYEDSHPDSPHSDPDSPHSDPDSPHSHPDTPHSHHSLHSAPRFSIPAFTDSLCGLPRAASLLKTLFPFHLEWKSFSSYKYKKTTNLDKLTEICFADRRMYRRIIEFAKSMLMLASFFMFAGHFLACSSQIHQSCTSKCSSI